MFRRAIAASTTNAGVGKSSIANGSVPGVVIAVGSIHPFELSINRVVGNALSQIESKMKGRVSRRERRGWHTSCF